MKKVMCAMAIMAFASVGLASPLSVWVTNNTAFGVIDSNQYKVITVVTNVTSTNYNLTAFGDTDNVRGTLGWPSDKFLMLLVQPTLKPTTNVPVVIPVAKLLSLSVTGKTIHVGGVPTVERIVNINSNNYRKISGSVTNFQYQLLDCGTDFKLRYAGLNADGTLQCIGEHGGVINVATKDVLWMDVPTIQPVDSTFSTSVAGVNALINISNTAIRAEIAAVSNVNTIASVDNKTNVLYGTSFTRATNYYGTAGLTQAITCSWQSADGSVKTNFQLSIVNGLIRSYNLSQ